VPEPILLMGLATLAVVSAATFRRRRVGAAMNGTGPDEAVELPDAQLREEVERAWAQVSTMVDRLIGSGQLIDRELLLDVARFLESAMPAVVAYERLLARACQEPDLAVLLALPGREGSA
jgi:hypothetical protein